VARSLLRLDYLIFDKMIEIPEISDMNTDVVKL
jgi:hypothetical protein